MHQVALGLLSMARKDLLLLNFEGILKYFRVQLPKRYRSEEAARQLMKLTSSFKLRKVKKYEKDWIAIKVRFNSLLNSFLLRNFDINITPRNQYTK